MNMFVCVFFYRPEQVRSIVRAADITARFRLFGVQVNQTIFFII